MSRRDELLVDLALEGLSDDARRELDGLGGAGDDTFALAAAAFAVAEVAPEAMPAGLAARLEAAVPRPAPAPSADRAARRARPRWDRGPALAWAVAGAAAALAIAAWLRPPSVVVRETVRTVEVRPPPPPSPAEARAALLAAAPDARVLPWSATPDAAARGASGDVVWSESRQQGYMRIRGLAPNDPARAQYQLWIFDGQREEAHPVDGGVFDVGQGEVVVPIRAAVKVFEPKLFAVTVERPGGVVVSRRERIVLTASL
jgi:hypothetical protein